MATILVAEALLMHQAHDPCWVETTVAEPAAPEMKATPHAERAHRVGNATQDFTNLPRERSRNTFIGIKDQNPIIGNRHRVQRPLTLAAKAFEGMLHKSNPPLPADFLCAV